jgi:hypothetical protein
MARQTFLSRPSDRWDLIAYDLWKLPQLGWEIARVNPQYAGLLTLPGGLVIAVPDLNQLRKTPQAVNPARSDDPRNADWVAPPKG